MRHIIIGAGAAGIQAAKTIRANQPDAAIVMISTDSFVHSRCMLHRYLSHERDEYAEARREHTHPVHGLAS